MQEMEKKKRGENGIDVEEGKRTLHSAWKSRAPPNNQTRHGIYPNVVNSAPNEIEGARWVGGPPDVPLKVMSSRISWPASRFEDISCPLSSSMNRPPLMEGTGEPTVRHCSPKRRCRQFVHVSEYVCRTPPMLRSRSIRGRSVQRPRHHRSARLD